MSKFGSAKLNGTDYYPKGISPYVFMQLTVRILLFSVNFSLQILNRLQSSTPDFALNQATPFPVIHSIANEKKIMPAR